MLEPRLYLVWQPGCHKPRADSHGKAAWCHAQLWPESANKAKLPTRESQHGFHLEFTKFTKSQPTHTPTLPSSGMEMPSNGRCLAWWQEEHRAFGLGGGQTKRRKRDKKTSIVLSVRVFSPPQGGCQGASVRKWLMPAKPPRRSYS